jgi:hypothetical protein
MLEAQEHFGTFLDELAGKWHPNEKPRPLFELAHDFRFEDPNSLLWIAPAGTKVDGASIPQFFWTTLGGPFEGAYINASVIHDHYCHTRERTAHDTHRNFYYGMRAAGVEAWKASLMHWAVATFGPTWKLEKRVVLKQRCGQAVGEALRCTTVPQLESVLVDAAPVDLSDPAVLAVAIGKFNAVARTLRTSEGRILDVSSSGPVAVTLEGVEANAARYREIFRAKTFSDTAVDLGVLAWPDSQGLARIDLWPEGRIPSLESTFILTPQTLDELGTSAPFQLDAGYSGLLRDQLDLKLLATEVELKDGGV